MLTLAILPSILSKHWMLSIVFMSFALFILEPTARAIVVQPSELHFESRLDDIPLLKLEVNLEGAAAGSLTADLEGFRGDRRVLPNGDGKFTVQIAPDTDIAGPISGKVVLKVGDKAVASPVPISGVVGPWVKVQPSRFFFGSIGHGAEFAKPQTCSATLSSDNEPFDIESVTFSGIEGASWTYDSSETGPAQKKHLTFTLSPDALAAGVPYGALAKKAILVHLSHSKAPITILPVQGLVSVNTTGRDYSLYLYGGHVRWQGLWATPNIAAAFLATALVLFCGLANALCRYLSRWPKWQIAWTLISLVSMGVVSWFLAATYSRGGWIAALFGIGVLLFATRPPRFYIYSLLGLFLLSIALHPAGPSRAASATLVSEDRSIHHRLLVWIGALQMMAEHPWTGVGAGKFGKVFERDYQLPTHTADYTTAINDFLTLGAERGLPALLLVTTFALGLVLTALRVGIRRGHLVLGACGAAIACYLVCCWFSSIGFRWNPTILPVAAAIGILGQFSWISIRNSNGKLFVRIPHYSLRWLSIFVIILAVLAAAEVGVLFLRPVVSKITVAGTTGVEIRPRWRPSKGAILYIGDPADDADLLMKSTLRPLARQGWTVITLNSPTSISDAFVEMPPQIEQLHKEGLLPGRWQLAGHRRGAQLALALAPLLRPQSVACYLTPLQSPFADLSPTLTLPQFSGPILLAAQDADSSRTDQYLIALQRIGEASHHSLTVDTQPGAFSPENARWQLWVQKVDHFCAAQQAP